MSIVAGFPPLEVVPEVAPVSDDAIRRQVWGILAGLYPRRTPERRADQRFPYPYLLYLTPVGERNVPVSESVVVVGKHLSERGLGFYYREPLPYRRMIASLELPNNQWSGFLIDITWCRFTQHGWYDSGGRFLQIVPSPLVGKVG